LIMPIIFILPHHGQATQGGFGIAFSGAYLGLLPLMGLGFLKYSQQWQAAEIFQAAPLAGPAALCHGARIAILFFITIPSLVALTIIFLILSIDLSSLKMLFPGLVALPVFAIVPCVNGEAVPLSQPAEEAKQASRGLQMISLMFIAMAIAGLAMLSEHFGFFWPFLFLESLLATAIYKFMHWRCAKASWPPTN
jgi:ABC-2 type transport system permease protein